MSLDAQGAAGRHRPKNVGQGYSPKIYDIFIDGKEMQTSTPDLGKLSDIHMVSKW